MEGEGYKLWWSSKGDGVGAVSCVKGGAVYEGGEDKKGEWWSDGSCVGF